MNKKRRKLKPNSAVDSPGGEFSFVLRRRRTKTDWAGIQIGDAFKSNLDFYVRIPAQRLFYQTVKKGQMAAAQLAGNSVDSGFVPRTKPQLGPCYTTYPSALATYAAVGLTAYLEFEDRVYERILVTYMDEYLQNPAAMDHVKANPEVYKMIAASVTRFVQTRLLLEDLSRAPALFTVEIYRLFSASQQTLQFESLSEIVQAVVLYGDILPDWEKQNLHPFTRTILKDLTAISRYYFEQLPATKSFGMIQLGFDWVRAICVSLAKHLPPADQKESQKQKGKKKPDSSLTDRLYQWFDFGKNPDAETKEESPPEEIPPLDEPRPPALFGPPTPEQDIARVLLEEEEEDDFSLPVDLAGMQKSLQQTVQTFVACIQKASAQENDLEDMRSDLMENALRESPFMHSPVEGSPSEGHEVSMKLGNEQAMSGEIFDRAVELSDNLQSYEKLMQESQPVIDALRRSLYPNTERIPVTERLRTSGAIDSARLAVSGFSSTIFKRYRIHDKVDRHGRPVLLIACDGSGSLNHLQMKMTKILAAAWLHSTLKTEIRVLAGLYHSGQVRSNASGPLVQWMYHPRKTPATNRREATRAIVSLPDVGTGIQSDALSITFMLQEARRIARGKMVYLILISDCEWNRCTNTSLSGQEEVYSAFVTAYEESYGKLHTTLVALGVNGKTGFEDLVDKVIPVPDQHLTDCAAVAKQIGAYVASCMKERRQLISKR